MAARCRCAPLDWATDGSAAPPGIAAAPPGGAATPPEVLGAAEAFDLILGSDVLLGTYDSVALLPPLIRRRLRRSGVAVLLNGVRRHDRRVV